MTNQAALKQTPLNATHRELGAKMVDFGGWDMPVTTARTLGAPQRALRLRPVRRLPHAAARHQGRECARLPAPAGGNNVDKLQVSGKALYSCMLNEAGGVIDDLIIYFMDETWFRLVVNAGTAEKDLAWMEK